MEAVAALAAEAVAEAQPPPDDRSKDLSPIAKGKRTKRHRPHSPIPFTITTHTNKNNQDNDDNQHHIRQSPATISTSSEESTTTEELDTARCLILLSRGYFSTSTPLDPSLNYNHHPWKNKVTTTSAAYRGGTKTGGGRSCVYTCKTCNRSFSSFQALGGHRASHKKPKNEKRPATVFSDEEDFPSPSISSSKNRFSLSLQLSNASTTTFSATLMKSSPSPRIHECSYCGAEFTSGQALGGHMRKHRSGPIIRSPDVVAPEEVSIEQVELGELKKPFGLSLDLNLPAPEDEKEKNQKENSQRFRPGCGRHYCSTID